MKRIEEAGSGGLEDLDQLFFATGERLDDGPLLCEQLKFVCKEECDAAVALAKRLDASPGNFACSNEGVETGWNVSGDPARKNRRFQERRRNGRALQALDRVEKCIEMGGAAAARREQALPMRAEPGQRMLLDRFHF